MRKWLVSLFLKLSVLLIVVATSCQYSNNRDTSQFGQGFVKHTHDVGHIDSLEARLNENFHVCDESIIYDYYNPRKASYSLGKNGLRNFILENYKNERYTDSGYLIFRFVINCKGEAGRYVIHENSLNLHPKKFNPELVEQLFQLTTKLRKWNPNYVRGEYRDSYMYINYRIENGTITEILP